MFETRDRFLETSNTSVFDSAGGEGSKGRVIRGGGVIKGFNGVALIPIVVVLSHQSKTTTRQRQDKC